MSTWIFLAGIAAQLAEQHGTASTPGTSRIVCEARPGHYDKQALPTSSGTIVSARIRLLEGTPSSEWAPAGGIVFKLVGVDTYVGIQVFVDPDRPEMLTVGLREPRDDNPVVFMRVPRNATIPVSARVEGGILTVSAFTKQRSLKLKHPTEPPALMCSSGRFEFEF